jgi:hypothetical protein
MCTNKKVDFNEELLKKEFNQVSSFKIPEYFQTKFPSNWFERNKDIILRYNPSFKIANFDSLEYLLVPSMNIPVEALENYNGNLFSYLNTGKLAVNNSELLVFENDAMLIRFTVRDGYGVGRDGISISDNHEYLKNINRNILINANLYFKITLTQNTAIFPIPGIIFEKNNKFKVLASNGKVFPVSEIYKLLFSSQKDFDHYINNIVEFSIH